MIKVGNYYLFVTKDSNPAWIIKSGSIIKVIDFMLNQNTFNVLMENKTGKTMAAYEHELIPVNKLINKLYRNYD